MPTEWQIECLRARIKSLKKEIRRVSEKDHPYRDPKYVYDALVEVINSRADLFDKFLKRFPPDKGAPELDRLFQLVSKDLVVVAQIFEQIARVDSPRIPFEILSPLSWVAECLTGEKCRVVVRLFQEYNYTIISMKRWFAKNEWMDEWEKVFLGKAEAPPTFPNVLVLGVPTFYAGSILLHVNAAHELGHQVGDKYNEERDEKIFEQLKLVLRDKSAYIQDYIKSQISRVVSFQSREDLYRDLVCDFYHDLEKVALAWGNELFADLVASRLVGPAFCASLDQLTQGYERPDDSHPPIFLRRKLLGQYIERSFPEIYTDQVWSPLFISSKPRGEINENIIWMLCHDLIQSLGHDFEEILKKVPSTFEIDPNTFKEFLKRVDDNIMNLSPPSVDLDYMEGPDAANVFWFILYAAWRFRLDQNKFGRFCEEYGWRDHPEKADEVLNNLIQHSLFAIDIKRRWREYSGQTGGVQHGA